MYVERCIHDTCPLRDKCGTYHAALPRTEEGRRRQPVTRYQIKTITTKDGKELITCKGFRYIPARRRQKLMEQGIIPKTRYGKEIK